MAAAGGDGNPRDGHSGRPLHQKLGLTPGLRASGRGLPQGYFDWLELPGAEDLFAGRPGPALDFIHVFLDSSAGLDGGLQALAGRLAPGGRLWLSWRKGRASDLSDGEVRAWGLARGLVDVKVCSVNAEWSGLKLVHRARPAARQAQGSASKPAARPAGPKSGRPRRRA
jgi:hypothetical protein